MHFKSDKVEAEFNGLPIFLQHIAEDMDYFSIKETGREIIITRVLEFIEGDSGVHEDNRAFDARDEVDGIRTYTPEESAKICDYLNEKYKRNDGKATCISHSFNGGPIHFHVQIAYYTRAYEKVS